MNAVSFRSGNIICDKPISVDSREDVIQVSNSNDVKLLSKALLGLAILGVATLQSCDKEIAAEAFNECPYQETVFTSMPDVKDRVDYVFHNLGLLPSGASVTDVDSICFSDKNKNRIQFIAPRDSAGYLKMDMKKISPMGNVENDAVYISNWGDRNIRMLAPLLPAHNNSQLFQSEFWDEPGRKKDTFTEIRAESGDKYYNHYCVERTGDGFQSRAAIGRGDESKTETYNNINVVLK